MNNTLTINNTFLLILLINYSFCNEDEGFCNIDSKQCNIDKAPFVNNTRYIFYDINPPEGFNLRRDVFMRYAIFAKYLKDHIKDFGEINLVLPPWSYLYHWTPKNKPDQFPWSTFFDLKSMKRFAPVIEMYEFFDEISSGIANKFAKIRIDEVYILQHYADMFESGKFVEKMSIEPCNSEIKTSFFYYDNITSDNIQCLSFHGFTTQLSQILKKSTARTILFDHAEVALHDYFGNNLYWQCRRSMRFNKDLQKIASNFRIKFFNSSTKSEALLEDSWENDVSKRSTIGDPYLSVHLRRKDFVWARPKDVPDINNAAKQIITVAKQKELSVVFIATDAPNNEYKQLSDILNASNVKVFKFDRTFITNRKLNEGELAVIDQIICAHGKYFLGTFESTFSFRIQEEREILGFPVEATFNRLCGDDTRNCEKSSQWTIVY